MPRFVVSDEEFSELLRMRKRLIRDDAVLPANVFNSEYPLFRVVDEARALSDRFLDPILDLSRELHLDQIILMMMQPDPAEYYYRHFKKYGVIVLQSNDSSDDVMTLCWEGPLESPADAFAIVVNTFALFPMSCGLPDWCVYRDRLHAEAGIIAFKNSDIATEFAKRDRYHITVDPQTAAETFMAIPAGGRLPDETRREFLENYGDKDARGKNRER